MANRLADNYIKSINNRLQRLRARGYDALASEVVRAMKDNGYTTRIDKHGNEVLSRNKANVSQYEQATKEEREYNKNEVYTIKEAKRETERREQSETQVDTEADQFSEVSKWYDIAMMLRDAWNGYLDTHPNHKNAYLSDKDAMNLLRQGGLDAAAYRELARQQIKDMIDYEEQFQREYDEMGW